MAASRPRKCMIPVSYEQLPRLKMVKYRKNDLFDVEIVERDNINKRNKIHYVGYRKEHDVWVGDNKRECPIVKVKPYFTPSSISFNDREDIFYERLAEKIQNCLSGDRLKDAECRFEVVGDEDVFADLRQKCKKIPNSNKFYPEDFNDLNALLGNRWYEKIYTRLGDFAYICNETIQFHVRNRIPKKKYVYHGGSFVESVQLLKPVLVGTFAMRSGNSSAYELRWRS